MAARIEEILTFWFQLSRSEPDTVPGQMERWFGVNPGFDHEIAETFGELYRQACAGELSDWEQTPRGALALILLFDQFSRNIYRGRPQAFGEDSSAQRLCLEGIQRGYEAQLAPLELGFFYMLLQHAEQLNLQELSVSKYRELVDSAAPEWKPHLQSMLDYAVEHRDIIARFGRFPHRNAILGRESTPAEQEFIAGGGPDYGQRATSS